MIHRQLLSIPLLLIAYFVFLSSCKKDSFITSKDASITTSADTLKYDTVFTSTGSVTQIFKINNLNNQKLLLNTVKLMGGAGSAFTININGVPGPEADNVTITANDSIYVFVTVNINPNTANLPFIVSDSILISYNGNNDFVQLQAYGQNAHFLTGKLIKSDTTWTNDLPYVILDSLDILAGATLTIQQGCRIYSHANAPFLVDGKLVINGTKTDSVTFTGDRLDAAYANLPASWPGIYFRNSSSDNVLTHAIIKNADKALIAYGLPTDANPKVTLHQCIIDNAYTSGIFCYNTSLSADNSLISNCGSNVILDYGGNYNLTYCTVASYSNSNITHKNPVLQCTNADSTNMLTYPLNAVFRNSIFYGAYGNVMDEVVVNITGTSPLAIFDHVLYEAVDDPANADTTGIIKNLDPGFDDIDVNNGIYNFHLNSNSSCIGAGVAVSGFPFDLDDSTRVVNNTYDLGCYEKQQ
jgi:hypothetical protein